MSLKMLTAVRDMCRIVQTFRRSDDDFAFRARRIRKVCRTYQATLADHNRRFLYRNVSCEQPVLSNNRECSFIIDPARKVGYCFISKVASTTAKTIFGHLLNISHMGNTLESIHRAFHEKVHTVSPMTFLQRSSQESYTTAMFVNHPFERLVFAYVDKVIRQRGGSVYFYGRYFNDVPGVRETGRNLTFPEFIDYILDQSVNQMNSHWTPYYVTCQPRAVNDGCSVRLKDIPPKNTGGDHGFRKAARDFFNELTFHQVMRLYDRFFFDFEMFGYDFRDYLH
ncbi:carbohydrate sulfotransferase 11-like [Ixodes scapularis]|uniref:carbohydrate sulfotransferase 11-like n=1 Tax=Ixodes scapularis TaxID=6945 RepID=UPI001C3918FE|nr:carbohydrate sulfotransferase 11-like [Ixodes scapularis]